MGRRRDASLNSDTKSPHQNTALLPFAVPFALIMHAPSHLGSPAGVLGLSELSSRCSPIPANRRDSRS
jgi:hypothetical protein